MSITKIEGIGPANAEKLARAGIRGVSQLLKKGATANGRQKIAKVAGVSPAQVLSWVNMADLFRIKGVKSQYAEILHAAGVDTVVELAARNPVNLHRAIIETNRQKKLVRQLPSAGMVESWVMQAKEMPRMVSH